MTYIIEYDLLTDVNTIYLKQILTDADLELVDRMISRVEDAFDKGSRYYFSDIEHKDAVMVDLSKVIAISVTVQEKKALK